VSVSHILAQRQQKKVVRPKASSGHLRKSGAHQNRGWRGRRVVERGSYVDCLKQELKFEVRDKVFLRGEKEEVEIQEEVKIIKWVGLVAYQVTFPPHLAHVHRIQFQCCSLKLYSTSAIEKWKAHLFSKTLSFHLYVNKTEC
jgi:hypothetical protein